MGGWKESGLGSRHGADGIRKYTKRQSLLVTPGYAPARELHMFPYIGEVTAEVSDALAALRGQRALRRLPSGRRWRRSATPGSRRSSRPQGGGRPDRLLGPLGQRLRGARRRSRSRCCSPELPAEQLAGLRGLLDALAAEGMVRRRPSRRRARRSSPRSWPTPRRPPASTPCAASACRSTTRFPTRHRDQPELARRSATRARRRCRSRPTEVERPITPDRPDSEELTLQRRRRGRRLRGRRGRDRRRARRRRQAGLRARDGRLPRRVGVQRPRALGLPEHLPERRAVRDRRGSGLDPGRHRRSAAARSSTGRTACGPPTTSAPSGRRARSRGHRRRRLRRPHGRGLGAARRERRVQRPERPAPAAAGGLRGPRRSTSAAITRNTDPRPTTRSPPATWASATSRARSARPRRPTSPTPPPNGADFLVHCRAERILVEDGRAAGRRGDLPRPRRAQRHGRRSGRRPSSSPAARSSRRHCCCAPGSAARPPATTCACTRRASSSATTRNRRTPGGGRRRRRSRTSSRTSTTATAS